MSTRKIFDSEEQSFIRLVDKFYLGLSLTKLCAQSCNLLRNDISGSALTQKEKDCLSICYNNIEKTQSAFYAKVKTTMNLPAVEDDGEEGGDDE
ncbi:hypothetical protein TTHERM_00433490 (macronuclear) [Tetrahymena thermophila SB210]|uniref:Tim10/DDP family zinc finger protein n=1 Tax=Tetrahymena thermophila (strain SB210) TaxID=312017 RepID=Q231A8_TETTS|nr:hypothetical protein TTHERM_00433490 [Tetrahymena thermophila SB210]7W5Z_T3 Chain T3, Cytochrome c oxidase small TIM subunit 3 [Tetrahymena thermophila]7W5Z_t3 Chain t3, Cytochrome c oxidase small TIM subunit 3 [Tetrahymena thermophila]8B6H_ET Chain ET, Zf-Tim10_DDP domain-containing protein [Tetrahymena thermophila SB210]8B6H_Et Chain Et, Zf-Tim10_DDP domain-containing protein [Tetrahymena thermophila SB210]8BQS_ET Chain ET, Zf-Tim10_DDP domain-containing protein [Tetrahymena thermophila S|eukprot:XP_001011376.2 hypothetical protein TTHERM_00433490 [Tetrahymena thermophila SB210]